jgi:NTE family protein
MRASIAISGLFRPCIADGEVLVDGALVNSLPTDAMETMCQGTIIAVDAARYQTLRPSRERGSGSGLFNAVG